MNLDKAIKDFILAVNEEDKRTISKLERRVEIWKEKYNRLEKEKRLLHKRDADNNIALIKRIYEQEKVIEELKKQKDEL